MPIQKELLDFFNDFYQNPDPAINHPTQGDIFIPCNQEEGCFGIIIISNACDLEKYHKKLPNNTLATVSYLPIYTPEAIGLNFNATNLPKWIKIITLNHPTLFFLPPIAPHIKNKGAIVNFQRIRSMEIEAFVTRYNKPLLTLKPPYRDKLNSEVCKLFNQVPINNPDENNRELFREFLLT